MHFDFKSFWNSSTDADQRRRGEAMVNGLVAIGYSAAEAKATVEIFQQTAFYDGEMEESFNNCGEDA